uniref:Uncharacterized protein n=1 Tax=Physcomitrium patens TaxID=3218 RepID=A0A2K1IAF5_PHYPA|nr:hypothetical protein PHYPA_030822 [Physcomitrium patens]
MSRHLLIIDKGNKNTKEPLFSLQPKNDCRRALREDSLGSRTDVNVLHNAHDHNTRVLGSASPKIDSKKMRQRHQPSSTIGRNYQGSETTATTTCRTPQSPPISQNFGTRSTTPLALFRDHGTKTKTKYHLYFDGM